LGDKLPFNHISDLYYNPITIIIDEFRVINKLETSLTDAARVIIYNETANFQKCKKNFEYQYLLLLRDIWCSKF